jgi:hypothetical protein
MGWAVQCPKRLRRGLEAKCSVSGYCLLRGVVEALVGISYKVKSRELSVGFLL